jgi:delta1-piperideine-2-carboxylate reductase
MGETRLTLEEVHALALDCLSKNGCDEANAAAVADTILAAERDLCHAHGLFRLPGYIASLRSGKVNGRADPSIEGLAPAVLRCDGDNGYAPLALQRCRDPLAALAADQGIAALALVRTHHFAALWIEVEALAELGLAAFAFTAYMPAVAPAGGRKPFFGTNPMAFGWPRPGGRPMVFDQASAAMARGEVMIAAREGHQLPPGVGIDAAGNPTNDPQEVLEGAMLPFGGHKGASLALMIELLVGPLIGERCSFEAAEADPKDGGPPRGGELLLAIDPGRFGDAEGWCDHTERLFERLLSQDGTRLPGGRRHASRPHTQENGIAIPQALHEKILSLSDI